VGLPSLDERNQHRNGGDAASRKLELRIHANKLTPSVIHYHQNQTIYKNISNTKVTILLNKNHWVETIYENNKALLSYQPVQPEMSYYKHNDCLMQGLKKTENFIHRYAQIRSDGL